MRQNGFSLVELSIVLVILGLLTGGILTGQNLIRAAELRAVTTEMQRFQAATQTFRAKYFAIPGDMTNATDFWGAMSSGTCPAASGGTGTETCNGNGNGQVVYTDTTGAAASRSNETYLFFQHLANAGLIEGSYSGIAGSGGSLHSVAADNVPTSKLGNASWFISYSDVVSHSQLPDLPSANFMQFGSSVANSFHYGAILKPEEMWNIDNKVDDGLPSAGNVIARYRGGTCSDATSSTDYTSGYALDNDSVECAMLLKLF